MYYKNWVTRFILRKNFFKRFGMRWRSEVRKLQKSEFDDLIFLYQLLDRNPNVIVDGGANVGYVSYKFHKAFREAKIYSVEPNPDVFIQLKKNLTKEQNYIVPINAGLGSTDGRLLFFKNNNTGTSSFLKPNDFHRAHAAKKYTELQVDVLSIPSLLTKVGQAKIDILKLDVEGYELQVLEGSKDLLKNSDIDFVFVEVNLVPSYVGQPLLEDIMHSMRSYGYVPYNIYGSNETSMREMLITNVLFASRNALLELTKRHGEHAVYVPD